MEKEHILLLIIFSILLKPIAGANDDCLSASCSPHEPEVRFPFRIVGQQPARCGFPGFDLSCDKQNRTIIRLSSSLSYIVNSISYISQVISIDPEFCRPNRIVDVDITDTPFSYDTFGTQIHTFYNCSLHNFVYTYPVIPFRCLRRGNYSVFASTGKMPSNCKVMKAIVVPVPYDMSEGLYKLEFMWLTPYCISCEMEGTACILKSDDGQTICVRSSRRKVFQKV